MSLKSSNDDEAEDMDGTLALHIFLSIIRGKSLYRLVTVSVTVTQVSITRRIQYLTVTRSFPYSTFPVIGYYTTFLI